jgi:hypothetical protein
MRAKNLLFAGLLILGVLLVAEAASTLAFLYLDGTVFTWNRLQQERDRVLEGGLEGTPEGALGGSSPGASPHSPETREARPGAPAPEPGFAAREVLHPFLGFVLDPAINREQRRRERGDNEITDLGFYRPPGPPPARTGDELRIGVFGGSAAFLFAMAGRQRLIEELTRLRGNPRGIVVDSFALGGYKQPQQLMALAYLLALGERFDVVINLDGFNEVALTTAENLPAGVNPSYPRGWQRRIAGLPDLESQALAGAILQTRMRRERRAARYSSPFLRFSVTANLLWRVGDRALQNQAVELERRLSRRRAAASSGGFQAHGPVYPPGDGDVSDPAEDAETADAVYRDIADLWRESSLQMHRLCEEGGILYLHLLQPNQYVPGSKPMGGTERRQAFRDDHPYRTAVVEGYPVLAEAGEALRRDGVRFHDLRYVFRDHPEPLYFDTCCHVNQRGNEILAERVAEILAESLPEAPAPPGNG